MVAAAYLPIALITPPLIPGDRNIEPARRAGLPPSTALARAGFDPAVHEFLRRPPRGGEPDPCGRGRTALAAFRSCAYSCCFNEHCPEIVLRPQQAAFAGDRGAFARGHLRPARSCRGVRGAQSADREEAHLAAGSDADQSLLRGLDP